MVWVDNGGEGNKLQARRLGSDVNAVVCQQEADDKVGPMGGTDEHIMTHSNSSKVHQCTTYI